MKPQFKTKLSHKRIKKELISRVLRKYNKKESIKIIKETKDDSDFIIRDLARTDRIKNGSEE